MTEAELLGLLRICDANLVAGALNEMVITFKASPEAQLVFHFAEAERKYMITHVDVDGRGMTAIDEEVNGAETIELYIAAELEWWPARNFVPPWLACGIVEKFLHDGGRSVTVEWMPSTAHI